MLLPLAAVAVGALIGFVGSRKLRRPQHAAQAASVARSVSSVGRRRTLTAPELQRACFSEMVRHVRVDRQGRTQAPGRYVLHVNPADVEVIDETRAWFVDGLREALQTAARDNGWTIAGAIDIRFEVDPTRRPGVPAAVFPEAVATGLALVRADTGERFALGPSTVTIGRSSTSTVAVDDTRVSRSHATVERARSGWTVTDTGSSNGTTVNGRPLTARRPKALAAGDVIGVGPVELRVEPDASAPPAGSRALDDSDRTRISGEVLPPPRRPRS